MFSRIWSTVATTTPGAEEFEAEWFMVQKNKTSVQQTVPHGCLLVSKIN
jgi:hypothetical protein